MVRYVNPKTNGSASESMNGQMNRSAAPAKSGMFTTMKKPSPNHGPKQPWDDLAVGPHTHMGARDAAMGAMPKNKAGTQATLETPAPAMTPKSMANKMDMVTRVKRDGSYAASDYPKG